MVITPERTTISLNNIAEELAAVADRLRQSTVQVRSRRGEGSGTIWNADGLIITNAHVARSDRAIVELSDGRTFEAVRTAINSDRDLAALQVEATDLPAATVGDSDALRVGELVLAMGNPHGVVGALTTGIIHAISPLQQSEQGKRSPQPGAGTGASPYKKGGIFPPADWIQADIRLAPGNSGGPLADARGRVIGINAMIVGGLGIAVPSKMVEHFLRDFVGRPYLGVTMRPILLELENQRTLGLLLLDVAFGSIAQAAGLKKGDVLIGICGQLFSSPDDLTSVLWNAEPSELLQIEFLRSGSRDRRTAIVRYSDRAESKTFTGVKPPWCR